MTVTSPSAPALALAAFLSLPGATSALAQRNDPGLRANCAGDYFRYCVGINPDGPEIRQCFRRNYGRLTPACRAAILDYDRRSPRPALGPATE